MGMKKLFVIGGMGAGKLAALDKATGEVVWEFSTQVYSWSSPVIVYDEAGDGYTVKADLVEAFGADILGADGQIVRSKVAAKAFATPAETRKLNRITMPRIEEAFTDQLDELERQGNKAVVVEYSVFKNRQVSMANGADVVIAVLAPLDDRIERAVAGGWDEQDVRRRIARQISDADRIEQSDVVFNNDGTPEQLREQVEQWWREYSKTLD